MNNFEKYYRDIRSIYTDKPVIEDLLLEPINDDDQIKVDEKYAFGVPPKAYSDLIIVNNKYYNELDLYKLLYYNFYKLLKETPNKTKISKDNKKKGEFSIKLKKIYGDQYNELIEISKEYDVELINITEFVNLPLEEDYIKFKRNITKKFNKLETMKKLEKKNNDQINSLKNYNLIKFKKNWIEKK
jgi:hypothetical protein